jgi:hypothetical protein
MAQTEAEKRFVAYHERLRAELNEGYWHFCAYTALEDALAQHAQAMEQAPTFFLLTLRAHRLQALAPLAKLLDNSAGSTGVLQLLRHVEKNPGMFLSNRVRTHVKSREVANAPEGVDEHTIVDCVQEDRKKLWGLPIADIMALRERAFAQVGERAPHSRAIPEAFSNRTNVEDCFRTLDDILNRYSRAFGERRWTMDLATRTFQRELDTLRTH